MPCRLQFHLSGCICLSCDVRLDSTVRGCTQRPHSLHAFMNHKRSAYHHDRSRLVSCCVCGLRTSSLRQIRGRSKSVTYSPNEISVRGNFVALYVPNGRRREKTFGSVVRYPLISPHLLTDTSHTNDAMHTRLDSLGSSSWTDLRNSDPSACERDHSRSGGQNWISNLRPAGFDRSPTQATIVVSPCGGSEAVSCRLATLSTHRESCATSHIRRTKHRRNREAQHTPSDNSTLTTNCWCSVQTAIIARAPDWYRQNRPFVPGKAHLDDSLFSEIYTSVRRVSADERRSTNSPVPYPSMDINLRSPPKKRAYCDYQR